MVAQFFFLKLILVDISPLCGPTDIPISLFAENSAGICGKEEISQVKIRIHSPSSSYSRLPRAEKGEKNAR